MLLPLLFTLLATATAKNPACDLIFDGRVPLDATGASFDSGSLPYSSDFVLGQNQTWAEVLQFPSVPKSLFDTKRTKPIEVTLSDGSIFAPSADNVQTGFRRSELLPQAANATATVSGVNVWHLSLKRDEGRPLNYSHEYYLFCTLSSRFALDDC